MGLTRAEFLRTLPTALEGRPWRDAGDHLMVEEQDRRLEITLTEKPDRALGSLRLPVLSVHLRFTGFTAQQVEAFMTRFERSYRRGGG